MSRLKLNCMFYWTFPTLVALLFSLPATQAAEPEPPAYRPVVPEAMSDDDTGFKPIFDGKSLQGWDGDRTYWRVENGAIVGETTPENVPDHSSFLIWRGGQPADFELKLEYQVSAGANSGIQYRSMEVPGTDRGLHGYQADIDGAEAGKQFFEDFSQPRGLDLRRITGMSYDEGGRTFLALPGQLSYVGDGETQRMVASLGEAETLADIVNDDWNRYHLIARGNVLIHIVNGRVTSMVIDDDTANRRMDGLLGLQVHGGNLMKAEFRNIRLKTF